MKPTLSRPHWRDSQPGLRRLSLGPPVGILTLWLLVGPTPAQAGVVYDLAADWSTTQNPFGAWSLYKSETALFTSYQPGYGWAEQPYPQTAHVPVWSLGEGGTNILVHSAELDRTGSDVTKARWTSPINGTATIQGGIWMTRDLGRRVGWQLRKNGVVLSTGEVYSGDPYDAANPFRFELGSGGAAALTQSVLAGDYLELALISLSDNGNLGEQAGLVFRVELTAAGCQPPPSGLVGWWPGDGNAADRMFRNDGTALNGAGFAEGLVGQAFALDGADDMVRLSGSRVGALDITGDQLTVAAWVRLASTNLPVTGNATIFDKYWTGSQPDGYALQLSHGRPAVVLSTVNQPSFSLVAAQAIPLQTWTHLAATYDGATARLYINGVVCTNASLTGNLRHNDYDAVIGNDNGGSLDYGFPGLLDEVTVFTRALSVEEIRALVAAGSAGMCAPTVGCLVNDQFDDGNLGTNTLGLGAGWIAISRGKPVSESDGMLHFAAGGGDWGNGKVNGKDTFTGLNQRDHCFTWMVRSTWFSHVSAGLRIQAALVSANGDRNTDNEMWLNTKGGVHGLVVLAAKSSPAATSTTFSAAVYDNNDTKPSGADGTPRGTAALGTYTQGDWIIIQLRTTPTGYGWWVNGLGIGGATWQQAGLGFGPGEEFEHGAFAMLMVQNQSSGDGAVDCDWFTASAGMCAPQCVPPPAGLVAWWRGEGDGQDVTGNHPATLQNNAGFTNGFVGQAFRLSAATTDHLRVANHAALNPTNITIAAWVKPFSYPTPGSTIVRKQDSDTSITYLLMLGDGATAGRPHFNCGIAAPQPVGPVPVPLNEWSHIVGTYDGTQARVYVNGVLADARSVSGPMPAGTHDLFIGRIETNPNRNFDGLIDEVAIWNRGLSSNEVAALYAVGSAGMCPPSTLLPTITRQPSNQVALAGWNVTFEVVATGGSPLSYQWFFNGGPLAGATDAVLNLPQATTNQAGDYFVVVSNFWGAATSQVATLKVMGCGDTLPNLVAWWPADGDANDRAGSHHGSLRNGATFAAGKFGAAFSLDGVNDYIDTGGWTPGSTWTVAAWVKPSAVEGWRKTIVGGVAECHDWGIIMMDGVFGMLGRPPGGCGFMASSGVQAVPGTWYFVVGTCDGSTGRVYVDGQLLGSGAVEPGYVGTSAGTWLGGEVCCPGNNFAGLIDEAMVFNRALAPEEVAFLFASANCALQPPFISQSPASQVVLVGQDVTFEVAATGASPLGYQWFFNGGPLAGATNATLNLPQVTTNQAGNYFVVVSNLWGAATSQVATLTVMACGDTLPNLVAWWPADGDATDRAGSHHGTLRNGATFAAGKVGAAFSLDGADDYIDAGRWTPGSTWTVAAWVNASAAPAGRRTILGGAADCADWGIVMQDGVFGLLSKPPSGCSFTVSSGVQAVPGTWYFVAATCDGSTARIYVDGELRASGAVAAGYVGTSSGTRLGSEVWCECGNFPGLIDEPMVFNRALAAEEIAFLFASATCAPQPPLIFQPPASQVALATRDVTLQVGAAGDEPLRYQWFFNGGPLAGATNAALSLPLVTTNQAGAYFVVVSNLVGAVTSQVAVLTVLPDTVGPVVTNFVPLGAVNTNVSRLLVQFNERINVDSFTTADVSVVTPGGALNSSTFAIQPVPPGDGTAFEVLIPSQSLEGGYTVRIGPFITDLAGNLMVGGSLFESQAFTSQPGHWRQLGHAAWNSGGFVRLTPATVQQQGSLVLTQALPAGPFVLSFDFRMSNGGGVGDEDGPGADGITLNILPHVPGTPFFYGEVNNAPTFHLFLDSYGSPVDNPGDTNGDHIAIGWTATNGSVNKAIQVKVPQRFIDTGLWHAEVEFDGAGLLTAHITSPTGAVTSVSQIIPAAAIPPQFYFGFGAYTGAGYANQDVDNVLIRQLTAGGEYVATFTIDKTGPSITGVSPVGVVSNTITFFDVSLDSAYAPGSLSAADVTISGPGAPAVQSVSSLGATSFRVMLAGPLPQGIFTITIGPDITDLAGNPMAAPFQANLTVLLPDLTVSSITAPASALAGQPLNLSWTVTNLGPGNVIAAWKSRVQLATNAAGEGAITLATFTATNLLAASTALSQTGLVILPTTAAGNRWLVVTADADDEVLENTETNNAVVATVPVALLTPDLALAGLSAPASAQFGQTIAVTWAVTNVGTAAALASWSDRVYLSAASNSISGATPLATVTAEAGPLPAGGGYRRTANVTLPLTADSAPGTFWLVAAADYQDAQAEATEANNLRSVPLALTLPPLPDLAVVRMEAPAQAAPNQAFNVVWAVTNLGSVAATGVWSETLLLTNTAGGLQTLATLAFTNALPAGGSVTRTQAVVLPVNGPAGDLRLLVQVDSRGEVLEAVEANNVSAATNLTVVPLVLTLQLPVAQVSEATSTPILQGTVTRNGSRAGALTVTLTNSDPTELSVPASVVIAAGAASAVFQFTVLPDSTVDGPQTVTVGARADGYQPAQASLVVLDADLPRLTLVLPTNEVPEGLSVEAAVVRDLVTSNDLVVTLASSSPGQLSAPASVVIPAYSNAAAFSVTAVDDTLVELVTPYTLTAAAAGYLTAVGNVTVLDNDVPEVVLALEAATVSENAGPQATVGTVTRTPASTRAVVVELTSTNPAAATVPATVTIPANVASATFTVAAVDNAVLDGPRTTLIGGYVLASGSGSRVRSITPALLTVTDDDGPALGLTISPNVAREGRVQAAILTVTRNTPATNALVVSLVSSDTAEATVPATVTIPAGQSSAVATVTSIADGVNDGNQTVLITASASGLAPATATIVITDSDLPDLFVASLSAPEWGETESYVNVAYRIANQGSVASSNAFLTRVFLSGDNTVGNDTLAGQFRFTGALPPGQFFEQTLPVRLPQAAGDYWLIVQTDVEDALAEMLEDNNTSISRTPISARASYGAWVQTDLEVALAGTPVPMSGRATNQLGGGAAYKLVNVHIRVRGTERIISALTDANGNYSVTFQPLPNEAGDYEIFATHPGVAVGTAQDAFVLLGMKPEPETTYVRVIEGKSASGSIGLRNLSDQALTGLSLTVEAQPAGLNLTASLSTNRLPGCGLATLNYTVGAPTPTGSGVVELHVTTTEGAEATVWLVVTVEALRPVLVANPAELVAGMARGRQTVVEFEVRNEGGLETGPITVSPPAADWLQLVSTNPLPSLPPGATNRITLLLTPPADLPLGPYSGSLALNCTAAGLAVPFSFRALSEARGDLLVEVVDEFTFYAEGAPKVTDALVIVRDAFSHGVITNGLTDTNGACFFGALEEGYYEIEVSAPRHRTFTGRRFLSAGLTNSVEAFINLQTVQYIWTVEPTVIEDRTKITIETVFESHVPAPVVTIEPALIDLSEIQGDEAQINLRIANHGLIAALDFHLSMPTHALWEFTPLVSDIGTIPAQSTLTIPLTIRRITNSPSPGRLSAAGASDCETAGDACYRFECGKYSFSICLPLPFKNAAPDCQPVSRDYSGEFLLTPHTTGQPSGGGGGGNYGPGYSGRLDPPSTFTVKSCEECIESMGFAAFNCVVAFSGAGPNYKCAYGATRCLATHNGMTCAGAVSSCMAAAGYALPGIGPLLRVINCLNGLVNACLRPPEPKPAPAYALRELSPNPDNVTLAHKSGMRSLTMPGDFTENLSHALAQKFPTLLTVAVWGDRLATLPVMLNTILGDEAWMHEGLGTNFGTWFEAFLERGATNSDSGDLISPGEQAELLALTPPEGLAPTNLVKFIERWNRTREYNARGIFNLADVPVGESTDFIATDLFSNAVAAVENAQLASEAEGFTNVLDGFNAALQQFQQQVSAYSDSGGGVCARVRLRLEQEAVISRDAFKATLEIINGTDVQLRDVFVELKAVNSSGLRATEMFGIRPPTLENLSAVDGTGLIEPQSTGKATWIIVPTQDAAPDEPQVYYIGGRLNYTQDGLKVSVPLAGVPITVYPNPRLFVKYFHQRDVFSDDPFTDVVEPSIPFNLAVMIENRGKGDARNVRITSAQPQIIENERGLLIDFQIIATEVAGKNMTPSLTAEFGTITNGQIAIGRWLLTSTLQGLFTDYKASFEHIDGLGNKRLSLIEEVTIHEMIRLVQAGGAFEDGRPDFLVNDVPDPSDRPDTLYLSNGSTNLVEVVETATVDAPPAVGHLQVHLTAPMPAGWAYLRVPEPGDGQFILRRVVRSDGAEISVGTNAWTTDRTFIGLGRRPIRENILHLLDHNSPGGYTLHYEPLPAPDTTAPDSQVAALPAASREAFPVQWGGSDDSGSVAGYDVFVSVNGGAFVPWLQRIRLTSAVFQGEFGSQYAFYSRAVDAAGNREEAPVTPDAQTTVSLVNHAPVIMPVPDQVIDEGNEFRLTPVVTDEDVPADRLTFSLLAGPPGLTLDAVTGQMRWLTGEAHGPSTNLITWTVRDDGMPSKAATNTFILIVNEVNSAPVLSPIEDATVLEGRWLIVTNTASDADLPAQQLTWSLLNAPAGATIDPASGLFRWRPSETQGGVTNTITVVVRDNGPGQLTATQTFRVTAVDALSDFAVSVGMTNLLAGQSSFVPLGVVAGVPLTNVSFTLTVDEANLTNLVVQPRVAGLSASALERVAANLYRLTFSTQPGSALQGTQEVARLTFATQPGADSALVLLRAAQVTGIGGDGVVYDNGAGGLGRVIVIGPQPVLADLKRTGQTVGLGLYGRPGTNYRIEQRPALGEGQWTPVGTVTLSGTATNLAGLPAAQDKSFYRAVEVAGGGLLTVRLEGGQCVIEWVPTRPNCVLEQTSALTDAPVWTLVTNPPVELTNGVARVRVSPTQGTRFYRLRCD